VSRLKLVRRRRPDSDPRAGHPTRNGPRPTARRNGQDKERSSSANAHSATNPARATSNITLSLGDLRSIASVAGPQVRWTGHSSRPGQSRAAATGLSGRIVGAIVGAIRSGIRWHEPAPADSSSRERPAKSARDGRRWNTPAPPGVVRDVEAGGSNPLTPTTRPLVTELREQSGPGASSFPRARGSHRGPKRPLGAAVVAAIGAGVATLFTIETEEPRALASNVLLIAKRSG